MKSLPTYPMLTLVSITSTMYKSFTSFYPDYLTWLKSAKAEAKSDKWFYPAFNCSIPTERDKLLLAWKLFLLKK